MIISELSSSVRLLVQNESNSFKISKVSSWYLSQNSPLLSIITSSGKYWFPNYLTVCSTTCLILSPSKNRLGLHILFLHNMMHRSRAWRGELEIWNIRKTRFSRFKKLMEMKETSVKLEAQSTSRFEKYHVNHEVNDNVFADDLLQSWQEEWPEVKRSC